MELFEKQIIFSEHALERAIERQFELREIRESLRKGFIYADPKKPKNGICIYKFGNQNYTIVFCEYEKVVVIITIYRSSQLEIRKIEGR